MKARTRRLIVGSTVAGLAAFGLAAAGWLAAGALAVGVGHKAKTLCSGVFVSRLDPAAVIAELQADDLAMLKHIEASIDSHAPSVTASFIGVITRRAEYREGLGCTLVLGNPSSPAVLGKESTRDATIAAGSALPLQAATPARGEPNTVSSGSVGPLSAAVARAFSEPDTQRRRRTSAVVIMQHGRVLAEQYAVGIGPETPLAGWSLTKSVMNALVGVLVREGRLALDVPVPFPEWQQAGDRRASVTLDHLLRMSSGLRFDEGMASPRSDVMRMLFAASDAARFAASKDLAFDPGTRWQYSSGTSNIIARLIRNVLHHETEYLTLPRRALFDRLGMSSAVLETDVSGTFVGSSYMYATARDWARFGTLYLQDGVWDGERVLPEGWVRYTTTPAPADSARRYGAHFWLRIPEEYAGADDRLPVFAFHAAGHEAQFVTIVPSYDVVIVRLGRTRYPDAWDHPAFVRDVLAALDSSSTMKQAPMNSREHS